jgi:hypothetical protein
MQRYENSWKLLDKDRDGIVHGKDCLGFFAQWGLDKSTLKHIW